MESTWRAGWAATKAARVFARCSLVHEDDGRRVLTCHDKEFTHHAATCTSKQLVCQSLNPSGPFSAFTNVLLHKLAARDTDEAYTVSSVHTHACGVCVCVHPPQRLGVWQQLV